MCARKKQEARETIFALVKEPGKLPEIKKIQNTLDAFQKAVGGYIETVTLEPDCIIICNEEGRLYGLPFNCHIANLDFYGTIVAVGSTGDDFCSIPRTIDELKKFMPSVFTV